MSTPFIFLSFFFRVCFIERLCGYTRRVCSIVGRLSAWRIVSIIRCASAREKIGKMPFVRNRVEWRNPTRQYPDPLQCQQQNKKKKKEEGHSLYNLFFFKFHIFPGRRRKKKKKNNAIPSIFFPLNN
jgi:hypothetical protein